MYRDQYSLLRAPWHMTAALIKCVIAVVRGMRRLPWWQLGLAASAALALLVSLLWLVPWRGWQEAPGRVPPPLPVQNNDRPGREVHQAVPITGQHEVAGAAAVEPQHSPMITEDSAEVLDTQAMQELLTRLETSGNRHAEHLDTQAMDNLLARLEAGDKTPLPAVPRPRTTKRRQSRSLPGATVDHKAHNLTLSPQQSDPALVSPAPGFP